MEEENPVKEYLFEHIKKSEKKFNQLFAQEKSNVIIDDMINHCYDKIDPKNIEGLSILATGILHYTLTNAMIPSNRKVEFQGTRIDIVIPDTKTLEKDPKKALIIYIPRTINKSSIEKDIQNLEKVQPEKQNIWVVLTQDLGLKNKSFFIKKRNNFVNILFEIANFVNVQGNNKLKILKI